MSIEIVAWRVEPPSPGDEVTYTVQTKSKKLREVKSIFSSKKDWSFVGEGYDPKRKEYILLFRRTFLNKKSWIDFAQTVAHAIEEISQRTGKRKVLNGKGKKRKKGS